MAAVGTAGRGVDGAAARIWEDGPFEDGCASWPVAVTVDGRWARLPESDRELGRLGEEIATEFLRALGYRLVGRNYRTPFGEADIVLMDGEEVVLAEVKTRRGEEALPEEAVDERKMGRYRNITLEYIRSHEEDSLVRFDVIAVNLAAPGAAHVHHFKNVCIWEG